MCAFESSNKPEEMNNEWTQDCADVSAAVFHVFAQGHRPFTITSTSCANFTSAYIKLPSALAANVFTLSVKGWCHLIVFWFFFIIQFFSTIYRIFLSSYLFPLIHIISDLQHHLSSLFFILPCSPSGPLIGPHSTLKFLEISLSSRLVVVVCCLFGCCFCQQLRWVAETLLIVALFQVVNKPKCQPLSVMCKDIF